MAVEIVPQKPEPIVAAPRRFNMRALWRLTAWGGAAALAVATVAVASQSETGHQRLALALTAAELPVRPVATVKIPPPNEQNAEVARLEAQVRKLAADRDRLVTRLASLEHTLDDVTGSIKRQAAQPAAPAQSPPAAEKSPPPEVSAPATTATTDSAAPKPESAAKEANAPEPPVPAETAAPAPAVPLPPVRIAAAPATEPAPPKLEFGVALASSSSVEVMRLQWIALKANFGPLLAGLRPIAAHDPRASGARYRLVLGPFPNLAAATKLCARLTVAHAPCHAGKFSGEPL